MVYAGVVFTIYVALSSVLVIGGWAIRVRRGSVPNLDPNDWIVKLLNWGRTTDPIGSITPAQGVLLLPEARARLQLEPGIDDPVRTEYSIDELVLGLRAAVIGSSRRGTAMAAPRSPSDVAMKKMIRLYAKQTAAKTYIYGSGGRIQLSATAKKPVGWYAEPLGTEDLAEEMSAWLFDILKNYSRASTS